MRKIILTLAFVSLFVSLAKPQYLLAKDDGDDDGDRYSEHGPMNFGVVVNNAYHTIYRSKRLGRKGLPKLKDYLEENNLPFPKIIIYMNHQGYKRSFPLVGRFALAEYELQEEYGYEFYHSYRYDYRTYLDGRNPYEPKDDIDSHHYLGKKARKIFGVVEGGEPIGGIDAFLRILNLVLSSTEPVLFHCTGGHHRTGMVALAIRYMQAGYWVQPPKGDVTMLSGKKKRLNPAQYEYYLYNKSMFRQENLDFIEEFSHDPRFLQLQAKYQESLNAK